MTVKVGDQEWAMLNKSFERLKEIVMERGDLCSDLAANLLIIFDKLKLALDDMEVAKMQ